jgi:hypothetical protein
MRARRWHWVFGRKSYIIRMPRCLTHNNIHHRGQVSREIQWQPGLWTSESPQFGLNTFVDCWLSDVRMLLVWWLMGAMPFLMLVKMELSQKSTS